MKVNLAATSINQTPLDLEGNANRIQRAVEEAFSRGAQLVCTPELCLTGYGCEDRFLSPAMRRRAMSTLKMLIREVSDGFEGIWTVGLPIRYRNGVYNCVAVVQNSNLKALIPKKHLANDGIHYEARWFKAWPEGRVVEVETPMGTIPMGDIVLETADGLRIGFEICEDAWSASRPGPELAKRGVDVIMNPSASHFSFGKQHVRRRFVVDGSRSYGVGYVYASLLGNESGRIIYDGSAMIAEGGTLMGEVPRFSHRDYEVVCRRIDVDRLRMNRTERRSFRPSDDVETNAVRLTGLGNPPDVHVQSERAAWEDSNHLKEEEFTRAVSLGLFDYLRKSSAAGYVVSLSGGVDSSATSVLVHTMQALAVEELGDLYTDRVGKTVDPVLTTIYQPTHTSSSTSRELAESLAEEIGSRHLVLDVDDVVEAYEELVGSALDLDWNWEAHDVELQNIQARSRAPSAWMVANALDSILLAPSNRSEASVGYATMDGDTCGGLSPLAGIDKAFLRKWLRWMETEAPMGIDPYPCLSGVNEREPTAELRPEEFEQTDESDLMPYAVLDRIERAFVRDRKSPIEIRDLLLEEDIDREDANDFVERFFDLWCRNQWKRERYAPSFHLDDENVDPKTGCRFPILSSGYEQELVEMRGSS